MVNLKKLFFATICVVVCATVLVAQEVSPKLVLVSKVEKEIKAEKNGKQIIERVPADNVKTGDVLIYTITYKNEGNDVAQAANIVNPIPNGTTYILNSASGKDTEISFSIDGGKYFQKPPVKYLVKKPDGSTEEKIATPEMYTHIMWTIKKPIPAGASGEVSFSVKVK